MHELAILYSYYNRDRALTKRHYECFVYDNPGVPVIPIVCGSPSWIPGTVDVWNYEHVWCRREDHRTGTFVGKRDEPELGDGYWWLHGDKKIWRYLRHPDAIKAKRYFLAEWDIRSFGMSVRTFCGEKWDADLAGSKVFTVKSNPDWAWFDLKALNTYGRDNVYGLVPFVGCLMSAKAAELVAQTRPPPSLFTSCAEMYAPTLCHLNKMTPVEIPGASRTLGTWGFEGMAFRDEPGIYHPMPGFLGGTKGTRIEGKNKIGLFVEQRPIT